MSFKRKMRRKSEQALGDPVVLDPPKRNAYDCPACGHITITIDIHEGTTPFLMACSVCKESARSRFYRNIPDGDPEWVWFKPTLAEAKKADKKYPGLLNHAKQGGLFARPA